MVGRRVWRLIHEQDQTWANALASASPLALEPPIVFVGSGSSYYIAQAAADVARRLGTAAWAMPSAEVWTDPQGSCLGARGAVIVSRSGTTSEAVLAAESAKSLGLGVHALTCNPHTPLEAAADTTTVLDADDNTVVMIQSFTSMLIWLHASLALQHGLDPATWYRAGQAGEILGQTAPLMEQVLERPPRRTIYLGAGARFAVAQEGALKALEMGGAPVLWYHPLEFRHGPWGSLEEGDLIWVLRQQAFASQEAPLIPELKARGARVLEVGADPTPGAGTSGIALPGSVPDLFASPVAMIPLQLYAWTLATRLGRDPDAPRNLTKVVHID